MAALDICKGAVTKLGGGERRCSCSGKSYKLKAACSIIKTVWSHAEVLSECLVNPA